MAAKKKDKLTRNDKFIEKCAYCGKEIEYNDYLALCDLIMQHKAVCSYECNKALGQVK